MFSFLLRRARGGIDNRLAELRQIKLFALKVRFQITSKLARLKTDCQFQNDALPIAPTYSERCVR